MAGRKNIGKTIILLFLILILILAGLLWFDYLGVIQAKNIFAPVYKLFGLQVQTSVSVANTDPVEIDLDNDRYLKRLEALNIRSEELNKREADITRLENLNNQVAQELEDRRRTQEEREQTFDSEVNRYDSRQANIIRNVNNLNSMPPQNAVNILVAMDDQDVIDILRKADELAAQEEDGTSLASYWLQLMPADRAAQIQRKMLSKPVQTTTEQ
ncbi:periplasmic-type flagellar collar protein FlbB [Treponema brennaborense]|uniref:Flagellar protein FlbB n=1 Tax=Treponema brennaborense (strain DSM 12168 / CIP 105900 / DD5/3) TaxID=906968 RepID=F4LKW8_TREBD|nr:hypothetical protein [Treponema brennaborense]AEE16565.1 hypothetical protein Trebr_1137 [Treponema brennaborense DSM 12168]